MLNKKIFLVFFFAFIIRLIALNQSLWLDEAVTANVVKNFNFTQIVNEFSPTDFHPPLYYLFMKVWTNIFGYSEIALRFPSVIFSLLAGYFVYKISSLFHGSIDNFFALIFFLFNPLIVYYSQEARMYMMATCLLTAGLYFFLKNQRSKIKDQKYRSNIKNIILMNLFFILSFYTFYGSIFLITTVFIYLLFKKQYKSFFVSCFLFLVSFILISPLLYHQLINSKVALSNVTNWSLVLGKANIKNLLLIPIKFSIGRISFLPKWFYWGITGIWTGFVGFATLIQKSKVKSQKLNSKVKSLVFLLILPLLLGFLVSFFTPMLQYFRFIYLIPIMALLLASRKNTSMYRYIIIIGFIIFSLTYLLLPQFHREDWKSLVKSLPKDKPVYIIVSSSDPVKYYNNNLNINELRLPAGKAGIADYELDEKQITVIPYTADIYGYDYKKNLSKNGYQLKKEISFREITYEQWVK